MNSHFPIEHDRTSMQAWQKSFPKKSPDRLPPSTTATFLNPAIGVAVFDHRVRCISINDSLAEMMRTAPDEIIGKRPHEFLCTEAGHITLALHRVYRTGRPIGEIELSAALSPAVGRRDWLIDVVPIGSRSNSLRHLALVIVEARDVSGFRSKLFRYGLNGWNSHDRPAANDRLMERLLILDDEMYRNALNQVNCSFQLRNLAQEFRAASPHRTNAVRRAITYEKMSLLSSSLLAFPPKKEERAAGHLERSNKASRRELQVLWLVGSGKTNKEIAVVLELSIRTVETYRARLMTKLGLRNAAEAVHYAIRNKLTTA